jgi:hypothetical protein
MLKNISIIGTAMLLLVACEKVEERIKVNDSPLEESIEDVAEEIVERLFPVKIELDLSPDKEEPNESSSL